MKTDLGRLGTELVQVLTDVPGWPDAPRWMRVRRVLPVLVPVVAAAVVAGWVAFVCEPERVRVRADHGRLFSLEQDVSNLRLRCSEQTAAEITQEADEARARLLGTADAAREWLGEFREPLDAAGWESTFQVYDLAGDGAEGQGDLGFVTGLARLRLKEGRPRPLASLLGALEEFSSSPTRIDLTRMVVRVDEPGRPTVEINLRIAVGKAHEKVPQ